VSSHNSRIKISSDLHLFLPILQLLISFNLFLDVVQFIVINIHSYQHT